MKKEDIEREYGPIQIVQTIEQALKDDTLTKQDWKSLDKKQSNALAAVLAGFGISRTEIEEFKEKLETRMPQAKL